MTGFPTMLLPEPDDDRTLVDPRFAAPDSSSEPTAFFVDPARLAAPQPPFEGSGQAVSSADRNPCSDELTEDSRSLWHGLRAKLSGQRRRMVETGVLLALVLVLVFVLVFVLGSAAYQQRRAIAALRETIEEMKTSLAAPRVQDSVGSAGRELTPNGTGTRLEVPVREITSVEREALEHRGATLIGSNNFVDALTHYEALTQLFPNEAVFRDLVIVLRAKLRCVGPAEPTGRACP